jgi:hypothetical protein
MYSTVHAIIQMYGWYTTFRTLCRMLPGISQIFRSVSLKFQLGVTLIVLGKVKIDLSNFDVKVGKTYYVKIFISGKTYSKSFFYLIHNVKKLCFYVHNNNVTSNVWPWCYLTAPPPLPLSSLLFQTT